MCGFEKVVQILTTVTSFHQEAAEDLAPRLEIILQHLMYAFGTYQVHTLENLNAGFGTLVYIYTY